LIGTPYKGVIAAQVTVWKECVSNIPWLNAAHRLLLRQICILGARMETGQDASVSSTHALSAMLSKLGATPTDESKSAAPSEMKTRTKRSFVEPQCRSLPLHPSTPGDG